MWRIKKWLAPLLALVMIFFLAACSAGGEDRPPEPEDGVLIYAALNPISSATQISIDAFNNNHEDVQIEVRDYSDEGGPQRLLLELTLGRVPDIMELHRFGGTGEDIPLDDVDVLWEDRPADEYWMPYRQMVQKGYLEDLYPYVRNDPDLQKKGIMEPLAKAAEVNGGLYIIFRSACIFTLMGPESIVGDRCGWTFEEMMEAFSSMREDSTILRYNATRWEVFSKLIRYSLDQFVDMDTGQCTFDSEEFQNILKFLKSFPEEAVVESDETFRDELLWRIRSGRQMLESFFLDKMSILIFTDELWNDRTVFPGYPMAGGKSGGLFYPYGGVLAMSSTCRNKDAAWEFLRKRITPRYNINSVAGAVDIHVPFNRHDYDVQNKSLLLNAKDLRRIYEKNPNLMISQRFCSGKISIPTRRLPTEEEVARFEVLLNNTTQLYWPNDELANLVWEAAGPYFAGDRSLDDTVALVQNRAALYVNENR